MTTNNRTLSGIISLSDGAGSVIENGKISTNIIDSGHLSSDTLEVERLHLLEHMKVSGIIISTTWLSYLYGLTGNIQDQITAITSTLLTGVNTWTGSQVFQGNVVNTAWRGTSSLFPLYSSTSIGAIYGRTAYNKAMSFLNSNNDTSISTSAFVWSKMDSASSDIELMRLSNNGTLNTSGNVNSPNIANMQSQINSLASAAQTNLANTWTAVQTWAAGNRIDFLGSTTTPAWPTRASNGAGSIWCRGTTIYNMALSFTNTNTNATAGSPSFVFTKQTGVNSGVDLLRINNDGSTVITGTLTSPTITTLAADIAAKQPLITTGSRLNANLIASGIVSNFDYECLTGNTTGNIQLQLNSKQPNINEFFPLNASYVGSAAYTMTTPITNDEYFCLSGVSSNIQTQISAKQNTIDSSNRIDASLVGTGLISNTEFNFINGVTGPIQSQINSLDTVLVNLVTDYANIDNTSVTTTLLNTNRFRGKVGTISSTTTYTWPSLPCYINVLTNISLTLPNPGDTLDRDGYTVDVINSIRASITITVSSGTGSNEIERDGISSATFVLNRRARKFVVLGAVWCVLGYNDN